MFTLGEHEVGVCDKRTDDNFELGVCVCQQKWLFLLLSLTRKRSLCPSRGSQRRLSTAEQGQASAEGELELERERVRQLLAEVERLKGEVERTRSAGSATPNASRIAELEALLSQARADVGKFQALAEKNASAYQNAMARLFPALSLLSARCVVFVTPFSVASALTICPQANQVHTRTPHTHTHTHTHVHTHTHY